MRKLSLLLTLALVILMSGCEEHPDLENGLYAEFKTNKGDFIVQFFHEKAPMTTANFVALAEGKHPEVTDSLKGKPYFDGLTFHRIIDGFMIQGGSPNGKGNGKPGYQFPNETSDSLSHDQKGILSMANSGPDTNGSQFFITLKPQQRLDGSYSVFGKVAKNQNIVDSIGKVKTDERDRPIKDVKIEKLNIIRKGKEAKNFDAVEVFSSEKEAILAAKQKAKEEKMMKFEEMTADFESTSSGLKYKITKKNPSGKKPEVGQNVKVHYTGRLLNGKEFDSSEGGGPIDFPIGRGRVIPGWDEGIMLLREGEKATLGIPAGLAYGQRGSGPIPPNSPLIFEVELIEVYDK